MQQFLSNIQLCIIMNMYDIDKQMIIGAEKNAVFTGPFQITENRLFLNESDQY